MSRAPTKAEVARVLKGVREAGYAVRGMIINRNGAIELTYVPLEAVYREINDPWNRPTSQSVIEAVIVSAIERGLGALEEPKNLDRLGRCDAKARAEIQRRVAKLEAEGRLGIGLAPPEMGRFRSKSGSSK
jgi:hypothetical protein